MYTNNITRNFGFDELYEGKVIKVNEDNSCYINIYKFFVNTNDFNEVYESNISVSTSDIENLNENFSVQQTNGILCKPFTFNTNSRIMNSGDDVLVLFLNGDPQRPYYIDAFLPSNINSKNGDIIFNNNNIEIYTEKDDNDPKLIIKIMDTKFELTKDSKLNNTVVQNNNTTVETTTPGNTVVIEGKPTNIDGELLRKYLEFNSVKRDFENLKDKYNVILSVADHYKLSEKQIKPLKDNYKKLIELVEPILNDEIKEENIDSELLNKTFLEYHKSYNHLIGHFLKIGGGGLGNNQKLPEVTDENLESVIRDMVYVVNTKTSKKFIRDIIEDGIFSAEEKRLLSPEIIKINNERQLLEIICPLYFGDNSIERFYLQYVEEYDVLIEYISGMMEDIDEDSTIGKDEFFNKFMNYFKKRVELYSELYDFSTTMYTNKKPDLEEFIKDGLLNSDEKKVIFNFFNIYYEEKTGLEGLCSLYSVNMNNYNSLFGIIETRLGKVRDTDSDLVIDKKEFLKDVDKFVECRNRLLETIIAVSQSYIDTLVEGIQIGGNNLIYNYSFLYEFREWHFPGYNENFFKQIQDDECFEKYLYTDCPKIKGTLTPSFFKAKKDDYLVLSLYLRTIDLVKLKIYIEDSSGNMICYPYTLDSKPSNEFKRFIIPITITKDKLNFNLKDKPSLVIENLSIGKSIDLTHSKLEFGTNPSEPSAAPEDKKYEEEHFQNIIHDFSSAIIQTTDNLKLTVDQFYSKVTEDIEEFRKQNASISVEIGNIDLNLSDIFQKSEKIIDNLGGMEVIKDSVTTYDKLCQLQLDYEGMHLSVKDLVGNVTNITGKLDGLLVEGGRLDSIKGSLLDYNNDLKGMGGVLKKIDNEMSTYVNYIDGVKDSISKIEKIEESTLTMKGSLNKIQNTLGHITGSNMLDLKYDKDGNIIGSKYIDNLKSSFSGVVTRLGKVETIASDTEKEVANHKKIIGDYTNDDSSLSILEQIGKLTVANDNVTTNVGKLQGSIKTNEKLFLTNHLNNFSKTHNLKKWSPIGDLQFDESGNVEISSALNVLTLQKYTKDWYFGLVGTNGKTIIESDPFEIDNEQLYKFSIFLKDHPNNTDGEWRIGARFFAKNNISIGGYINNSEQLTNELWFDNSSSNRITKFTNFTGYIYPHKKIYKNEELMIKGTSKNCIRFHEDAIKMQLLIEFSTERGTPLLYIDNPEFFEVKSSQIDQLKLLQDALISVEPDNIMMAVKNHKEYQQDFKKLSEYSYGLFDVTSKGIDQLVKETTVLDKNGNPIKIKDAFNETRQNLDGTMTTVAKIEDSLHDIRKEIVTETGLSITGNNIFKLKSDGSFHPETITLYAYVKDTLGVIDNLEYMELEWYIDGVKTTQGVAVNQRSIEISSSLLKNKGSILVKCKTAEADLYDEITIIKLVEGKNAVNLILSNEFIGLPATHDGIVTDYSKAVTYIDIYEGIENCSKKWEIEVENNSEVTGVKGVLAGQKYTVLEADKDNATIKIKASRVIEGNKIEVFRNLQVNKIKKGQPGIQGNDGYSVILTNEAQPIPVKNNLVPFEDTSYFTDVKVYRGSDEINNFTISIDEETMNNSDFSMKVTNEPNLKSLEFRTNSKKPLKKEGVIPIIIEITDDATNIVSRMIKNLSWTCSIQGESAQIVTLRANCLVFKSHDGGKLYNPEYIIANANFKNCKFEGWYISAKPGAINYVPYDPVIHDGIIITPEYIKVMSNTKLFNDKVSSISIKVQSDVKDMYDVVTITRLYDRDDINDIAEKAKVAYSFIEQNSDKIEEAVVKSEFDKVITDLNKNMEALDKGKNNWAYDVYYDYRKERDPAMEAIIGYSPKEFNTVPDSDTILLKHFEDKIVRFYTSVYVDKPFSLSTTVRFFSKGTLYLNSTRVLQRLDNKTSSEIKLNFSKGWNIIEIIVLGNEIAGFIIDSPLSKNEKINAMNAYAIMNDYTKAQYSYTEIEKTSNSIKQSVVDLSKGIDDVYSEIEQTKDDWNAKFVDKGYKNYVDNGDFATGRCEEWFECYYSSNGKNPSNMADSCSFGPPSDRNKMLFTNNENCLEIKVVNLRDGAYGAGYKVEGLTIGEKYTLCAEVAGTDSEKAIFVTNADWKRYNTSYLDSLDGGVHSANWAKVAVEFTAEHETAHVVFRVTKTLNANPGYLWAKRVGVYNGLGWRPFMRSGNEVYAGASGEVKINMNGIHVTHSLSNTYTQLDSSGFKIFSVKTKSPIAWFGDGEGTYARIPQIHCDNIQAGNVSLITSSNQNHYYVIANNTSGDGSGRDDRNAFSSVMEAIQKIKETNDINKPCILNRTVIIHVRASSNYYAGFQLSGFQDGGSGEIIVDLAEGAKFNSPIVIKGNDIPIQMNTPSWGNQGAHPRADVIVGNSDGIIIENNSKRLVIGGICVVGNYASGRAAIRISNSEVYLQCMDISYFNYGIKGTQATIYGHALRGNANYEYCIYTGTIVYRSFSKLRTKYGNDIPWKQASAIYDINDLTELDSQHNPLPDEKPPTPPPPVTRVVTETFSPSRYYSVRSYTQEGVYNQGGWYSSYGNWEGHASFGNAVRNFCEGGSNITMKAYFQRKSSSHGYSTDTPVHVNGEQTSLLLGRGKGGWVNLSSNVVNHLASGGELTSYYPGALHYILFETNIRLQVTCTKPV